MKKTDRMYLFLLLLTIATALGFQGWRSLFNNFAVEQVGINGAQMGVIQSVREIPGFLALLVVYLLLFFKEHVLARLSVFLLAIGIFIVGYIPTYSGLLLTTVLMSIGFHYYETLNQSLSLQYFSKNEAPVLIAKLKSSAALTNILVGIAIVGLIKVLTYQSTFALLGLLVFLIALSTLRLNPTRDDIEIQHKKMIFKKQIG